MNLEKAHATIECHHMIGYSLKAMTCRHHPEMRYLCILRSQWTTCMYMVVVNNSPKEDLILAQEESMSP